MGLEGGNDMYVTENIYSCDIFGFEGVQDITDDVTDSTTASVIYKGWCRSNEILCEYATDMGYCKVTACLKRNIKNGIKYNVL